MTAERFTEIRKKKGSQFFVANLLGVCQAQISIWEKAYKNIPSDIADEMEKISVGK